MSISQMIHDSMEKKAQSRTSLENIQDVLDTVNKPAPVLIKLEWSEGPTPSQLLLLEKSWDKQMEIQRVGIGPEQKEFFRLGFIAAIKTFGL